MPFPEPMQPLVYFFNRPYLVIEFEAGGHSTSLGPCPTKLPMMWDTGSDQSSLPAYFETDMHMVILLKHWS